MKYIVSIVLLLCCVVCFGQTESVIETVIGDNVEYEEITPAITKKSIKHFPRVGVRLNYFNDLLEKYTGERDAHSTYINYAVWRDKDSTVGLFFRLPLNSERVKMLRKLFRIPKIFNDSLDNAHMGKYCMIGLRIGAYIFRNIIQKDKKYRMVRIGMIGAKGEKMVGVDVGLNQYGQCTVIGEGFFTTDGTRIYIERGTH